MAADGVPERYLDGWARLQLQRPIGVDELRWRRATNDAALFPDRWGKLAESFGWLPGDLFDFRVKGRVGLVWLIRGDPVRSLGPESAILKSGKTFNWRRP
jgi:hypothetical protein